jgi:hypothetical protein
VSNSNPDILTVIDDIRDRIEKLYKQEEDGSMCALLTEALMAIERYSEGRRTELQTNLLYSSTNDEEVKQT